VVWCSLWFQNTKSLSLRHRVDKIIQFGSCLVTSGFVSPTCTVLISTTDTVLYHKEIMSRTFKEAKANSFTVDIIKAGGWDVDPAFAGWQKFDSSPGPWFYTLKSFGRNLPTFWHLFADNKSPGFSSENLRAETSSRKNSLWPGSRKERQVNVICPQSVMGALRGCKNRAALPSK
jgi:hypothetical protein